MRAGGSDVLCQAVGAGVFVGVPVPLVARIILASTSHGDIVATPDTDVFIATSMLERFQVLIGDMTKLENMDAVKYSTFFVIDFKTDVATLSALYQAFVFLACDIVGVSHHGGSQCSAVFRRTKPRVRFRIPPALGIVVDNVWSLKTTGLHASLLANATYEFLQAWGQTGGEMKVNFELLTVQVWTKDLVLAAWSPLSPDEIMMDILTCEEMVVMKRKFSARDLYISKMGRKLLAYLRDVRLTANTCIELATNPDLMSLESFDHLGNVVCRTFDVITGALIQYPVMDWLKKGWFKSHTLILHGDAGLGKTPLAMTLLSEVATHLQSGCQWAPYFIKVGTVEALRDASNSGLMKGRIPILFDDLSPDAACGTRSGMPIESLKLILEVTQSSSIHARFKDLVFAADQPRIFTANASNPKGWHKALPADPFFSGSDADRQALDFNVKAAFKRCCFAFVGHSLVSQGARDQHQQVRRTM